MAYRLNLVRAVLMTPVLVRNRPYQIPTGIGTSCSLMHPALVVVHVLKRGTIDGARIAVTAKTNRHACGIGVQVKGPRAVLGFSSASGLQMGPNPLSVAWFWL